MPTPFDTCAVRFGHGFLQCGVERTLYAISLARRHDDRHLVSERRLSEQHGVADCDIGRNLVFDQLNCADLVVDQHQR